MTAPAGQPKWPPPTVHEIAELATRMHWVLEQFAYDLPAGSATREQRDAIVTGLRGLAAVLEHHDMTGAPPLPAWPADDDPTGGGEVTSHG